MVVEAVDAELLVELGSEHRVASIEGLEQAASVLEEASHLLGREAGDLLAGQPQPAGTLAGEQDAHPGARISRAHLAGGRRRRCGQRGGARSARAGRRAENRSRRGRPGSQARRQRGDQPVGAWARLSASDTAVTAATSTGHGRHQAQPASATTPPRWRRRCPRLALAAWWSPGPRSFPPRRLLPATRSDRRAETIEDLAHRRRPERRDRQRMGKPTTSGNRSSARPCGRLCGRWRPRSAPAGTRRCAWLRRSSRVSAGPLRRRP